MKDQSSTLVGIGLMIGGAIEGVVVGTLLATLITGRGDLPSGAGFGVVLIAGFGAIAGTVGGYLVDRRLPRS